MFDLRQTGAALLLGLALSAGALEAQAPAAPAPAPRRSWTADRQEYAVGDVITVLIDEHTLAAANKGNFASDRRQRDLSLGVAASLPSVPSVAGDVSSRNDATSQQRGESTQQTRFQGEMTVRVTEKEGDLLRVEGTKIVNLDGNQQELVVRGWVRPQDVTANNMVDSWRLGDAEIAYTSTGSLGKPRGGIIGRIFGAVWP